MLLLLWSCTSSAPQPESRAGVLANHAALLGQKASELAQEAEALEGRFDAYRAAPPEERDRIKAEITEKSIELRERAQALAEESRQIEAATVVYPE